MTLTDEVKEREKQETVRERERVDAIFKKPAGEIGENIEGYLDISFYNLLFFCIKTCVT